MRHVVRLLAMGLVVLLGMLAPARADAQVRYASKARFTSFVAGVGFTCAIAETGQTFCWGHHEYGQAGGGAITMQCTRDAYARGSCARGPVEVRGRHRFVALGAGDEHACGIDGTGSIWCWGRGTFGTRDRWGQPERCPLAMDGAVLHVPCSREPARMPRGQMAGAIAVDGGEDMTCAVDQRGAAWCWDNSYPARHQRIPLDRPALTVAAGGHMACVLTDQGGVRCWDMMDLERDGVTTPTPDTGLTSLVVGTAHACALDAQGAATCWGSDRDAALGIGRNGHGMHAVLPATRVLGAHRFAQLVAGPTRTCGIDSDRALWCWGRVREATPRSDDECFSSNLLRGGDDACTSRPVRVHPGLRFTTLAIGGAHQCGLTKELGSVCWGAGEVGQLGNGSLLASDDAIPVRTDGVPSDLAFMLDLKDRFGGFIDHGGLGLALLAILALVTRPQRARWSLAHHAAAWAGALALLVAAMATAAVLDGSGAELAREARTQLVAIVVVLGAYLLARALVQWWRAADAHRPAAAEVRASAAWDDGRGRNRGLVVVLAGWALLLFTVVSSAGGGPYDEVSGGLVMMGFLVTGTITLALALLGGGLALARLRIHRDDGRARLALGLALATVVAGAALAAAMLWPVR